MLSLKNRIWSLSPCKVEPHSLQIPVIVLVQEEAQQTGVERLQNLEYDNQQLKDCLWKKDWVIEQEKEVESRQGRHGEDSGDAVWSIK